MSNSQPDFNFKRFLTILIPFGLLAMLMLFTRPNKPVVIKSDATPLYFLHLESKAAAGSIILNDISIAHHKSGEILQKSTIALTPWLKNGVNKLFVSTRQPIATMQPSVKVSIEIHGKSETPITKTLFNLSAPAAKQAEITAANIPRWNWQSGEATFHDLGEIKSAVKSLHQAFIDKDIAEIRKIEAPLFNDMVKITKREGLERRHYRNEIIQKGAVDPLTPLVIIPFSNGRLMRVTQKDGDAPIRIFYSYGGGGKVILTGKFWSKIDGEWRVVR